MSVIEPVNARTLDVEITQRLRQLVLEGHLPPGTRLLENQLARELGVSAGTVRAALHTLRHEGILDYLPNKGASVATLDARDAWEIYTLRNTLEAMGSRLAAERMSSSAIQALQQELENMARAVADGDGKKALRSDRRFHRIIMEAAGHRRLAQLYDIIEVQTSLFMTLTEPFHDNAGDVAELHRPLAEAIVAGDSATAEELAKQHNTQDGERLYALLSDREAEANDIPGRPGLLLEPVQEI
jgi:DNA-binding GntR family transcriptional regulator